LDLGCLARTPVPAWRLGSSTAEQVQQLGSSLAYRKIGLPAMMIAIIEGIITQKSELKIGKPSIMVPTVANHPIFTFCQ
jgi:hypothetical protein